MNNLSEDVLRADVARLLLTAVEASGRTRGQIASEARVQRDALRRILEGTRAASLGEMFRILAACGLRPQSAMLLYLACGNEQAVNWIDSDFGTFLAEFSMELPAALHRVLGNQLNDVKPRWAKGAAGRLAQILSEHITEMERKDALLSRYSVADARGNHVRA